MGCPPPPPPPPPPAAINVVVQSKKLNANGVNILMVYETAAPLILAHVEEKQELKDPANGRVVRVVTLDFWEWFTPQLLPAGAGRPPNMPVGGMECHSWPTREKDRFVRPTSNRAIPCHRVRPFPRSIPRNDYTQTHVVHRQPTPRAGRRRGFGFGTIWLSAD